METTLEFAISLARQTGEMLLDRFKISGTQATLKPDHSVVTESDLAADRMIAEAIKARYPSDRILSEELRPEYAGSSEAVWVIDPLDGTTNYSLGLPFWGTSICRVIGGWPDTSVIYFPILNELYAAQRGSGAGLNGDPLHIQPWMKARTSTFFACCSRTYRRYHVSLPYKPRILGSAPYNFCCVARGNAVIAFEARAKVWDLAGAWLVVQEAGGLIEPFGDSAPFPLVGADYTNLSFPTLAAQTPELLAQARAQIQPKTPVK